MKRIVLLRHGESTWNQENRFTGWIDVGLSGRGLEEAAQAGRTLVQEGFTFEVAFMLRRPVEITLQLRTYRCTALSVALGHV